MKRLNLCRLSLAAAVCLALILCVPALAVPDYGYYVYLADQAELLSEAEKDALEAKASAISETYGFDPYIITVDGLNGLDVTDLALSYWDEYNLGYGELREGSLLLLSMEDRDFDYEVRDYTNAVFDEYRRDSVQQAFLAEFRYDNWYDGFMEYLNATEHYLSGAADDVDTEAGEDYNYYGDYVPDYGRYEDHDEGSLLLGILFIVGIPCLISGLICLFLLGQMKSVRHAAYAGSYVTGGLKLRTKEDVFTHRTETRTKIERDTDHSSSSHGGGGGGGSFSSSGKF